MSSSKQLREAFDDFPIAGVCKINYEKMEKAFDICCRVSVHYNSDNTREWTFLHYTPKAKRNFRATISEDDAHWLINRFNLREVQPYMGRSLAYVPCIIA